MQDTILAISGRPGLFRLVSRGRGMLIVETIDAEKKRIPAGPREQVTSLNDVSMYTDGEDVPLMEIFQTIYKNQNGQPLELNHKKASKAELEDFMASALPNYDRDRVYSADMKKLLQWYNILVKAGYTQFAEAASTEEASTAE